MLATKNGYTEIVKFLVDHGADIHRQKAVNCTLVFVITAERVMSLFVGA